MQRAQMTPHPTQAQFDAMHQSSFPWAHYLSPLVLWLLIAGVIILFRRIKAGYTKLDHTDLQ